MSVTFAPPPHLGKGFVARRIHKRDGAAFLVDLVGADVLRDAAAFAAGHVDADDLVQQRRLAVVDVAEEGDHRSTGLERLGGVLLRFDGREELVLDIHLLAQFDLDAELDGQQVDQLGISSVLILAMVPRPSSLPRT